MIVKPVYYTFLQNEIYKLLVQFIIIYLRFLLLQIPSHFIESFPIFIIKFLQILISFIEVLENNDLTIVQPTRMLITAINNQNYLLIAY